MKKGDKLPVSVGGVAVGYAEVEHVGTTQVTVFIPAMRSVLGVRVELSNPVPPEPTKQVEVEVTRETPVVEPQADATAETVNVSEPAGVVNNEAIVASPNAAVQAELQGAKQDAGATRVVHDTSALDDDPVGVDPIESDSK